MSEAGERFKKALERTIGLRHRMEALTEATRRIRHDARNSRHHALLLRTLSRIMRRARG